jgi:hypothetical protein
MNRKFSGRKIDRNGVAFIDMDPNVLTLRQQIEFAWTVLVRYELGMAPGKYAHPTIFFIDIGQRQPYRDHGNGARIAVLMPPIAQVLMPREEMWGMGSFGIELANPGQNIWSN